MVFNIFFLTVIYEPLTVHGAVVSKVVSSAGKKIAKEAIKDTAVNMTFNMVMDYKYVPKDKRKAESGYQIVCMPKDKKASGDCAKPIQVKVLTSTDKKELGQAVERNLDKKIAGGAGSKKWFKFLDWLVPVWLIGLGFAVVDYAIDKDVSSLFDDVAWDSLVELGMIKRLPTLVYVPDPIPPKPIEDVVPPINIGTPDEPVFEFEIINLNDYVNCGGVYDCLTYSDVQESGATLRFELNTEVDGVLSVLDANGKKIISHGDYDFIYLHFQSLRWYDADILRVSLGMDGKSTYHQLDFPNFSPQLFQTIFKSTYINNKWVLNNPDFVEKFMLSYMPYFAGLISFEPLNEPIIDVEPLPEFDQLQIPNTNKPGTSIPVIAPGAFPMEETGTGITVYPYAKPDGTTGYRTADGREVHPDNITVKDPVMIENPDGSITVEKAPTLENPTPEPEIKPPVVKPPVDEEIPEGGTCSNSLKKPNFKPVLHAFTNAFPFSIPWDIKRFIDNAFGGIGSERPSFKLSFFGDGVVLEIPEYFDSWIRFAKAFTIISFDVGLIFLFYRFMKGGGD